MKNERDRARLHAPPERERTTDPDVPQIAPRKVTRSSLLRRRGAEHPLPSKFSTDEQIDAYAASDTCRERIARQAVLPVPQVHTAKERLEAELARARRRVDESSAALSQAELLIMIGTLQELRRSLQIVALHLPINHPVYAEARVAAERAAVMIARLRRLQRVRRTDGTDHSRLMAVAPPAAGFPVTATEQLGADGATATASNADEVLAPQPSSSLHRTLQHGHGAELPYRNEMERLFGQSLAGVSVQTGMAEVLAPLGARALTVGNVALFADSNPSPAIVAHETAHVMQNRRAGIAAPMPGDELTVGPRHGAAEAEADNVAARVATAGPGVDLPPVTASPGAKVQLAPANADDHTARVPAAAGEDARINALGRGAELGQRADAVRYYALHQPAFLLATRVHLTAARLTTGHPQVGWAHGVEPFITALCTGLTGPEPAQLVELIHPSHAWQLIDEHRATDSLQRDGSGKPIPVTGAMEWSPAAGLAVARAVELALRMSLPRMSARYLTASTDGYAVPRPPEAAQLVTSHPMDHIVAEALCAEGVVVIRTSTQASQVASKQDHDGYDVQGQGLRLINYAWLGRKDAGLWNWLQITEPADATPEEVSLALWNTPELAYRLTQSGAYVGVPPEWAREFPEATAHQPTVDPAPESPAEQLVYSAVADDAALAEAKVARRHSEAIGMPGAKPPSTPDHADLVDALASSAAILDEMVMQLVPWRLDTSLGPARVSIETQQLRLGLAAPAEIAAWAPVTQGQQAILRDAAAGLQQTLSTLGQNGITPAIVDLTDRSDPAIHVLRLYAQAAGTSQLVETARRTLAQALAARAMLPVALLQRSSAKSGHQLRELRVQERQDPALARGRANELASDQSRADTASAVLQSQVLVRGAADPGLLERATLDAAMVQFRARLANLQHGLGNLRAAIEAADTGAVAQFANSFAWDVTAVPMRLDDAVYALQGVDDYLAAFSGTAIDAKWNAMPPGEERERGRQFELTATRRAALTEGQQRFAAIVQHHQLDGALFRRAEQTIQHQRVRTLAANVGAMLGLAVFSGGVAATAGEFVTGVAGGGRVATVAGEAVSTARTARLLGGATNFLVDAGVNAVGQTLLQGGEVGGSFVDNLASSAAVLAALRPLQAALRAWGGVSEQALQQYVQAGQHWKLVAAKGVAISAELVTSMATAYAAKRLLTYARGQTPDEETVIGWALQGASMAVGRMVHMRLQDSMDRLRTVGRAAGDLVRRMTLQQRHAHQLEQEGLAKPDVAMDLLAQQHELADEETAFWRKLLGDLAELNRLGMTAEQVQARIGEAAAQRADAKSAAAVHLPLLLSQLTPEVGGGRLWVGDADKIPIALDHARRLGIEVDVGPVEHRPKSGRTWHVMLNGEAVVIRERAPRAAQTVTARVGDEAAARGLAGAFHAEDLALMVDVCGPPMARKLGTVLNANPELQAGLSAQSVLSNLMARKPVLTRTLVEVPDALRSLLNHPEAIPVLEKAFKLIEARGVKAVATAPKPKLTTPLSAEQRALSTHVAASTPGAEVIGDRVTQVKPMQRPRFDLSKKNDRRYLDEYLNQLYLQAETAQGELNALTTTVAGETGGTAGFRPGPKSLNRSKQKIAVDYEGDASQLIDLAASKIEYQTLDELYRGFATAIKALDGKIVYIKDRFMKPGDSGYRDILLNVKMSNGHIAEFHLHLESISKLAAVEHALYEVRRSIQATAEARPAGARGVTLDEMAIVNALNEVTIPMFDESLQKASTENSRPHDR